jgi:hypothetical protein
VLQSDANELEPPGGLRCGGAHSRVLVPASLRQINQRLACHVALRRPPEPPALFVMIKDLLKGKRRQSVPADTWNGDGTRIGIQSKRRQLEGLLTPGAVLQPFRRLYKGSWKRRRELSKTVP